jgi:hypothetical protein
LDGNFKFPNVPSANMSPEDIRVLGALIYAGVLAIIFIILYCYSKLHKWLQDRGVVIEW